MAVQGVVYGSEFLEFKTPVFDLFIADGVLEVMAKNVLSQHANDNGRIGLRESFRRPIHEFGEIEQEGRLDLVFGRRFLREASEAENQTQEQRHRHPDKAGCRSGLSLRTARSFSPGLVARTRRMAGSKMRPERFCIPVTQAFTYHHLFGRHCQVLGLPGAFSGGRCGDLMTMPRKNGNARAKERAVAVGSTPDLLMSTEN